MWITVAFLATTWASETQGFPEARHAQSDALANTRHAIAARNVDFGGTAGDHDFETVQVSRFGDKSVLVAQATRGDTDTEELQKALEHEHRRSELLIRELCKSLQGDRADRLEPAAESGAAELKKSLQQESERAERLEQDLAVARRDVETQTALAAKANDDATQLKQVAEGDAAELRKSQQQERERAEGLEQDLAAARREVETQTALTVKANDDATQLKQVAEGDAAELRKSLQQGRERAERLEQDLAAARRDVETQTALATRANDDATELKQVAESGSAELKRSLQKEHDRAETLSQDLSMARATIYAYEAQARKAGDQAAGLKRAEESSAAWLRKSLVQEWERKARLQQELAAARRDVETQTALAAKAGAEAARLRQVAENGSAELKRSLQQERDRGARLERELVSERKAKAAPAVSAVVTAGQVMQDKQVGPDAGDREGQTAGRAGPRCRAAYSLGWLLGLVDVEDILDVIFRDSCIGFARSGPGPKPVAADQATVAKARGEAQLTRGDASEVARLVARASVLLSQGDIGSARIVLERAAETGSAQASFTLAETYDPLMLLKWGTYGTRGDAAKARDLYAKAQAGGIKEATERLDALRR
jgi:hypothetical protein